MELLNLVVLLKTYLFSKLRLFFFHIDTLVFFHHTTSTHEARLQISDFTQWTPLSNPQLILCDSCHPLLYHWKKQWSFRKICLYLSIGIQIIINIAYIVNELIRFSHNHNISLPLYTFQQLLSKCFTNFFGTSNICVLLVYFLHKSTYTSSVYQWTADASIF